MAPKRQPRTPPPPASSGASLDPINVVQSTSAVSFQPRTMLTKYERTKVIGIRAEQLTRGAEAFVDVDTKSFDPYEVAERELVQRKLPFIIVRHLPDGKTDNVKLEDMEIVM